MGEGWKEQSLWYNIKYDRIMLMSLHRNADVCKLIKGNDEFYYMYVAEKDRPILQMRDKKGTYCMSGKGEGCTQVEDHGVQENDIRSYAAVVTR